ncbi:uncharacterized protein [Penaeus vannamei]|uniref:uncharacterized protein n=1 Tax=Penaeus vannamei TaxID=6689 RepID=UPI00387F47B5
MSPINLYAGSAVIPLPDPLISEYLPSLGEVREAISKLKSGKAAGISGIRAELLKAGGESMARGLHVVLAAILAVRVPGKVLAHILLRRIRVHLLRHQKPEQSEFTPGKSTIDCILALGVIVECRREFGLGLLAAYIDLKMAFDIVRQESL